VPLGNPGAAVGTGQNQAQTLLDAIFFDAEIQRALVNITGEVLLQAAADIPATLSKRATVCLG
jgi:hypothetical protein